jgi:hypothetical protein
MGKVAMMLGLIGGIVYLGSNLVGLVTDWDGVIYMGQFREEAIPFLLLIFFSLICILGAVLCLIKPMVAAILMLITPVAGFFVDFRMIYDWGGLFVFFGLVLGTLFLIPGAILAILLHSRRKSSLPGSR